MVKKVLVFLILFSVLMGSLATVSGYTESLFSGTWNGTATYPTYQDTYLGDNQSYYGINKIEYPISGLSDMEGIEINFTINSIHYYHSYASGLWAVPFKSFTLATDLHTATIHTYNRLQIKLSEGMFWDYPEILVGSDLTNKWNFQGSLLEGSLDGNTYSIQLWRVNETCVKSGYNIEDYRILSNERRYYAEYFTVDASFWTTANFTVYIAQQGLGNVDVTFTKLNVETIFDPYPSPRDVFNGGTAWMGQTFDFLAQFFNMILDFARLLGSIVIALAPYAGVILLFYIMDVLITSLAKRSFQPIGKMFLTFWDWIIKIYDLIIKVGTLIWDAITFWN